MSKRRLAAIMFTDIVGYHSLLKEMRRKRLKSSEKTGESIND